MPVCPLTQDSVWPFAGAAAHLARRKASWWNAWRSPRGPPW